MSIENEPTEPLDEGIYNAPKDNFITYWHGLSPSEREQYIAMNADLFLANKEFLDSMPKPWISRDQLIESLTAASMVILTLKR
jgi:hypothetical protein